MDPSFPFNFLILALLFALPGLGIYITRPNLRSALHTMMLASLPFALTERWFYPSYWEPSFLWDLGKKWGFGIEDFIFVMGLSMFTTGSYPYFCSLQYKKRTNAEGSPTVRFLSLFGFCFLGIGISLGLQIPLILSAPVLMILLSGLIIWIRADLRFPAFFGGFFSVLVYFILCLVLMFVFPSIFKITWHSEQFLNVFVFGVPLEELLYGFTAGSAATVFYPFVFNLEFESITDAKKKEKESS